MHPVIYFDVLLDENYYTFTTFQALKWMYELTHVTFFLYVFIFFSQVFCFLSSKIDVQVRYYMLRTFSYTMMVLWNWVRPLGRPQLKRWSCFKTIC